MNRYLDVFIPVRVGKTLTGSSSSLSLASSSARPRIRDCYIRHDFDAWNIESQTFEQLLKILLILPEWFCDTLRTYLAHLGWIVARLSWSLAPVRSHRRHCQPERIRRSFFSPRIDTSLASQRQQVLVTCYSREAPNPAASITQDSYRWAPWRSRL